MNNIIRYEVYDHKDRWMGGYSTQLDKKSKTSSFEMAKINATQSSGKVMAVLADGSSKQVFPDK
jgi:hypothetical protein